MSSISQQTEELNTRTEHRRVWLLLVCVWAFYAALVLSPGSLLITSHWGDALHLVDILDRMSQGQMPHRDFVTPIGILAFLPISALMSAGVETGQAYLITQLLLAGVLGAIALAIGLRRLRWPFAICFAGLTMVTALALTHGRPEFSFAINVHYNRWGWAISFVALLTALFQARQAASWEGVALGLAMAALALIKITYFAAFLPVVVLSLTLTRQLRVLKWAAVTGVTIALVLTLLWGVELWRAYFSDLSYVVGADARPNAGRGVLRMVTSPKMLLPTVVVSVSVVFLARLGRGREALLLTCLYVAGAYVSDQNAGFDPLYLAFLSVILFSWAQGLEIKQRFTMMGLGVVLFVAIAPNVINLTISPLRAAVVDRSNFVPLVIGHSRHQDILLTGNAADASGQSFAFTDGQRSYTGRASRPPLTFLGDRLPTCQSQMSPAYFASIADDLAERGLAQGSTLFVADYLSPLWLFGDHPPLPGAAPWSYGGLHGIENADFIVFPTCPNRPSVWRQMLHDLEAVPMSELVRTPLYRLYAVEDAG